MTGKLLRVVLDRSRNARAFELEESFWCRELGRILDKIGQQVESLRRSETGGGDHEVDPRPFLSIAIFGPSGSGKSSLLRTLTRYVNLDDPESWKPCRAVLGGSEGTGFGKEHREKVHALPVIQADRFAEHDHFLYSFLASALKDDKELGERRRRRDDDGYRSRPDALSPVQQAFQELGEFLRVIDEPEKSRDYDPLGLSLERLERHTSGLLLRDKLGRFIDSLATQLTESRSEDTLILLPVDDADMSPDHLVRTLKTYQSYLLHPRLVPVFTFTDRTAEEILRVHFQAHVASPGEAGQGSKEARLYHEPGEGTEQLPVSEQLALQFLARCFPVRNRIRLGPAPARMRASNYQQREDHAGDGEATRDLLSKASNTLFGCKDRESENDVRAALRPATLRRQLHVVDELAEARVQELWDKDPDERPRWIQVYDRASWSLMNVHRDVLREYDLHLEDLYSWTPRGLQRVVLDTLLGLDLETRRALLRRWRRRTASRRGQTLSLLAANVFRPWLPGEEPSGDQSFIPVLSGEELQHLPEGKDRIAASTAAIWFLRLTIGFYLPQVLAWYRPNDIAVKHPEKGRISGVGWDLASGPVNAIRAAEANDALASSGMLFLQPKPFADALEGKFLKQHDDPAGHDDPAEHDESPAFESLARQQPRSEIMLRSWGFHGFGQGRYWSAVSLWRGLGLVGQLLEARRKLQLEMECARKVASDQDPFSESSFQKPWEERVRGILRSHLVRGMVPDEFMGEQDNDSKRWDIAFQRWDLVANELEPRDGTFAGDLFAWLNNLAPFNPGRRLPVPLGDEFERQGDHQPNMVNLIPSDMTGWECRWSRSLVRRMHGDDIVGHLFPQVNSSYIEDQGFYGGPGSGGTRYRWSAGVALVTWNRLLLDYWRGLFSMQELLRTCPLIAPFSDGPLVTPLRQYLAGKEPASEAKVVPLDLVEQAFPADLLAEANGDESLPGGFKVLWDRLFENGTNNGDSRPDPPTRAELQRFLRRLGVHGETDRCGSGETLLPRLHRILKFEIDSVLSWAPVVRGLYRLPRVDWQEFRPARSSSPGSPE